jgi:small nuclear ribonucleoprotein (snRNP)-like protein
MPTDSQVRVIQTNDAELRGVLRSSDDHAIRLLVTGREEAVPRAKVDRVLMERGNTRKRHAWIGALLGGLGSVIGVGVACNGDNGCMEGMPVFFWPALGIGALVGHSLPAGPTWQEIYARH